MVVEGICTPQQLREDFTFEDVVKATEMLEIRAKIEEKLSK